jgi:antitoxin (DNA-binding transcriptional repressor) of toxin-antitoxin stability system
MTTMTVTVQDAQQRLLELLSAVSNGSTIIIEKDKKPFARLVGIPTEPKHKKRTAGLNRGEIQVSDDFDAPLPDEFWIAGK